jgi:histidinol-phosphatase (PHP family)
MLDAHLHTHFSTDSEEDPKAYISEALKKGIQFLTFTDHVDLLYPHEPKFEFDIGAYNKMFSELNDNYGHQLHLYKGVELGLMKTSIIDSELFVENLKPDFVLCSLHTVDGEDLYYGNYFKRYTALESLRHYFTTLRDIIDRFKDFNVIGHLDLPKRYNPDLYKIPENQYMDLLDDIFDILRSRDQGIEINSSGLRAAHKRPYPDFEIISHYIHRGGKIITFGSDSHSADTLGEGFDLVKSFLLSKNIDELYVFKNMKHKTVSLR